VGESAERFMTHHMTRHMTPDSADSQPPSYGADEWQRPSLDYAHPDGVLRYIDIGQGPTVVLVHGTPTWSIEWRHVIDALASTHRVLAPDHLGFGRSARPATADYSPEAHARRFADWAAHLGLAATDESSPLTLVLHDFGGPIALDWALQVAASQPQRLARIVLVNTWCWDLARDPALGKRARLANSGLVRFLYRHFNASPRWLIPAAYGDKRRLEPAKHRAYQQRFPDPDGREQVLFALARSLTESAPWFEGLWARRAALSSVPLHFIWGLADSAFPPSVLEMWTAAFPHATPHTLAGVGHWPHEEAPGSFLEALLPLLQGPAGHHG
jgi:haloalkane dehalogenase